MTLSVTASPCQLSQRESLLEKGIWETEINNE